MLRTPPAFILSQDQTLSKNFVRFMILGFYNRKTKNYISSVKLLCQYTRNIVTISLVVLVSEVLALWAVCLSQAQQGELYTLSFSCQQINFISFHFPLPTAFLPRQKLRSQEQIIISKIKPAKQFDTLETEVGKNKPACQKQQLKSNRSRKIKTLKTQRRTQSWKAQSQISSLKLKR